MNPSPRLHCSQPARTRGSALIIALWVVILLTVILSQFAFDMAIESRIASYGRKRLRAASLAQAGIERARMLLVQSADPELMKDTYEKKDKTWCGSARNLARGSGVYGYADELQTGTVQVDIVPEVSRRNVNRLSPDDWDHVLHVAGIPEEFWDELKDCFFDWVDPDIQVRPKGAEEDYYGSLDPPYLPKNAPLYTVDELLLIKGFTPAFLYGAPPPEPGSDTNAAAISGIADLLTTFGDGRVNVNAASRRVLMTLPGVDENTADQIVAERERPPDEKQPTDTALFESAEDFFKRFPVLRSTLQDRITTAAGVYRITSIGRSQGVEHRVSCMANVDTRSGAMNVLRWLETEGD